MTTPKIDLERDCELFVDFDTDFFDSQRDKILDRSGNGRHPEAKGGPTLGADGPDDFEAALFDGSDDLFTLSQPLEFSGGMTNFAVVRSSEDTGTVASNNRGGSGSGFRIDAGGGEVEYLHEQDDPAGGTTSQSVTAQFKNSVVGRFDGSKIACITDLDSEVASVDDRSSNDRSNLSIGALFGGTSQFYDGKIASFARWSRALNDDEVAYLNRLTEPRRARL
jgi:hypothetical protein